LINASRADAAVVPCHPLGTTFDVELKMARYLFAEFAVLALLFEQAAKSQNPFAKFSHANLHS
jgi:hypothetical protein